MVTKKSPSTVAIKGNMAVQGDIWLRTWYLMDIWYHWYIKPDMWHVTVPYLIAEMQKQFETLENGQRGGEFEDTSYVRKIYGAKIKKKKMYAYTKKKRQWESVYTM